MDRGGLKWKFFTLGDFVESWIAEKDCAIHPTNAAASGLYDLCRGEWNVNFIKALQLADIILPKITHENKPVKFVWKGRHIIMYPALGDQQAALLGSGLHNSTQLSINMGTGAQVSVVSDSPNLSGAYQTRPYFAGKYLLTVPHIPSGRALNVYFRFVREIFDRADENITDYEIGNGLIMRFKSRMVH